MRAKQVLLIVGGVISVGFGILGAFLPILPTTPFLLLAAFFFARSSDRMYDWLLGNRLIGEYLRRYYEGRGMSRRHKLTTITLLWGVLGISAMVWMGSWWMRAVLSVVGIAVTIHILRLPGAEDAQRS